MFSFTPESRMSRSGAQHHKSSKETIQSNTGSISDSSVHNTSDASRSYYLEKPDLSFRNQAQSDRSSTATSTPKQGPRSLGAPSRGNENESSFSPRSSIYSLATDPNSSPIHGAPPSDGLSAQPYGDSQPLATAATTEITTAEMPPVGATPSLPPRTGRVDTTSLDPRLIEDDFPNDLLLKPSASAFPEPGEAHAREGRVLESKVARAASKGCSVEEVTALLKEVDHWLTEVTAADQSTALFLSSMFLKTILANHVAFSDASASLTSKVNEVELEKGRLEAKVHEQKVKYSQKVRECQDLRTELSRLTSPAVLMASPTASAHADLSSSSQPSASPPSSSVTSRTSLPHPEPSPYYNRRHEKEKEKLRELTQNNSSGSTGHERPVPESDGEAERTRSNRRQLLDATLSDALATTPPPPPSRRPTVIISRASTATEEMERERERRRRQSNEYRGPETPIVNVPTSVYEAYRPAPVVVVSPSPSSPPQIHAQRLAYPERRSATDRRPSKLMKGYRPE